MVNLFMDRLTIGISTWKCVSPRVNRITKLARTLDACSPLVAPQSALSQPADSYCSVRCHLTQHRTIRGTVSWVERSCTKRQEAQAQTSSPMPQMGGVNTGGTHPAVLDKEHRPITAGGFVKSGPIIFQDIAQKAGLTTWKHTMGTPEKHYIIESNGSGVGLLDYDNDGWLDIYLVNGSTADALAGKAPAPKATLFHNNHDGTFTDVAAKAGVTNERWGIGVASPIMTTTGGRTSTSPTSARTVSITTTTTAPLPTSQRRRE